MNIFTDGTLREKCRRCNLNALLCIVKSEGSFTAITPKPIWEVEMEKVTPQYSLPILLTQPPLSQSASWLHSHQQETTPSRSCGGGADRSR